MATKLTAQIYQSPGGNLISDITSRLEQCSFSTNEHGTEAVRTSARASLHDAYALYDRPGLPHLEIGDGAALAVTGRVEDVTPGDGTVEVQALGYWRGMSDIPYTELWVDSSVTRWFVVDGDVHAGRTASRYRMDTNNRLFIAPTSGEPFNTATIGTYGYAIPSGGTRLIQQITFTYQLLADANWVARLNRLNGIPSYVDTPWSLTGNGSSQSGTVTILLNSAPNSSGCAALEFEIAPTASLTYTGASGDTFLRITNMRIQTVTGTVTANLIAADMLSQVGTANPGLLSTSTALIGNPGLTLPDIYYEDASMASALDTLAGYGDAAGNRWEVGVNDQRQLYLRQRGSAAQQWYVDVGRYRPQRTINALYNSAYGVYKDSTGRSTRTATTANAASVARWGLTRRRAVRADTTSATTATTIRDTALADSATPTPRVQIETRGIYDASGARRLLREVRAGDSLTIRNLPPTLSTSTDRTTTFRVYRTEYDARTQRLTVEPESSLPSLEFYLARAAIGA